MAFSMNFVSRASWLDDSVAVFTAVFTFAPMAFYGLTVLWIICRLALRPAFKSLTSSTSDNMQAALAKFSGLDSKAAEAFVNRLVEQDLEALRRVTFLLNIELMSDPGKSRTYQYMTRASYIDPAPQGADAPPEDSGMFDTGDLAADGKVEKSKWEKDPPNRMLPIPASRGVDLTTPKNNDANISPPPPPLPPPPSTPPPKM
jgi:hypothetical protein